MKWALLLTLPWSKYFFAVILFNSFRLLCVLELAGLYNLPYLISLNVSNNQLEHVFSEDSPTAIRVRLIVRQWELIELWPSGGLSFIFLVDFIQGFSTLSWEEKPKEWKERVVSIKKVLIGTSQTEIILSTRYFIVSPADIYLFEFNDKNTRKRCEICSDLSIKTPERCPLSCSDFFIVNSEHISYLLLAFLLLNFSMYLFAEKKIIDNDFVN